MFSENTKTKLLSAAEISSLWLQYNGDSMAVCVYKYFLATVEDKKIKPVLEYALESSEHHLSKISGFLNEAHFQLPQGFAESDVNLEAPRLFSDPFLLYYTFIMTIHGLTAYSLALSCCEREELQDYFLECIISAKKLFQAITVLARTQPKFSGIPSVPSPREVELIQNTGFLSNLIGDKRPLDSSEISSLIFNSKKTGFVRTLSLAFSQVAANEDVRDFMLKNVKLAEKDADSFDQLIRQDDLTAPPRWDDEITDSRISPFSDKLMMFHAAFLVNTALSYYGSAMGASLRSDIILNYRQVSNHALQAGAICYNILVKYGWLEQQPQAIDRRSLALNQST
ncbi:DUF3231 family protein [Paenibacillus sp. YN15]|uniref:DUF3231 family protein n=1 Tax=Paenibacillus sp. YN15 TaxID=1742774 RepID=UPI000DCC4E0B|nr:DUF3231 family protein [Paenibacillus sp. YN15]RAV00236.1 hypothetical protein DQG13_14885 [Paenibacillus sp. YN15]